MEQQVALRVNNFRQITCASEVVGKYKCSTKICIVHNKSTIGQFVSELTEQGFLTIIAAAEAYSNRPTEWRIFQ